MDVATQAGGDGYQKSSATFKSKKVERSRRVTPLFFRHALLASLLITVVAQNASVAAVSTSDKKESAGEQAARVIEKKWGIRVVGVRRTAADYMLDFRFHVLNKDKLGEIMDRKVRPVLEVEGKDIKLNVPVTSKLGSLRQSPKFAKANKTYFMLFANPGKIVKKGDKVTVKIGKFKIEHLVVQ